MSRRRDILEREVTVCGLLARPDRHRAAMHATATATAPPATPTFRPDDSLWTCQACARLTDQSPFGPPGTPRTPGPAG